MLVGHKPESVLSRQIVLPDEAATLAFAASLAQCVGPGLLMFLHGDLGAGKTTLVRGLLRAAGVAGRIKSPTYTLVESYAIASDYTAHHFDLYRFSDAREWLDAGFDELLNPSSLVMVEWPEKAAGCLPVPDVAVRLSPEHDGRRAQLDAFTEAGFTCLTRFNALNKPLSPTCTSTC